jgi:hypothetical protein
MTDLFIQFPDGWVSPTKLPPDDRIEVAFPANGPIGEIHIRIAVRDTDSRNVAVSLQAGLGEPVTIPPGGTVTVVDEDGRDNGTASRDPAESRGIIHLAITFNVEDQLWTLGVHNATASTASINGVIAGTEHSDADTLQPWIVLPAQQITLQSFADEPAPETATVPFSNIGTGELLVTQDTGQPLPGGVFELQSIKPNPLAPGDAGTMVFRAINDASGLLDATLESNDNIDAHARIQIKRDDFTPDPPPSICMACASGHGPGEPKCSSFLGPQTSSTARCQRSFCNHTVQEHG